VANAAAAHGLLILVAAHRLTPESWPGDGLWYEEGFSEDDVKDDWSALAEQLCNQWNVVGVDLQNEPHTATWGKGNKRTDWNQAAGRLGNHVLSQCPRWLIFVEGIFEGAPGEYDDDKVFVFDMYIIIYIYMYVCINIYIYMHKHIYK